MAIVLHTEPARDDPDRCEIRLIQGRWSPRSLSIKYASPDVNGKIARGGEVPIEALPQMLEMALRAGVLRLGVGEPTSCRHGAYVERCPICRVALLEAIAIDEDG